MLVSKINLNNVSFRANESVKKPENQNVSQDQNDDSKMSSKTKVIIAAGVVIAAGGLAYWAGKNHHLGDGIYNFLNKNSSSTSNAADKAANSSLAADKLDYEVVPVKYDKNLPTKDEYGFINSDIYRGIVEDMEADEKTKNRLLEIMNTMQEDVHAVRVELAKISGEEIPQKPKAIENSSETIYTRAVAQKRYFSLPENRQEGYSCLDPLKYQKPREEIVDLQAGFDLLNDVGFDFAFEECKYIPKEQKTWNSVRQALASKISAEDSAFLDECEQKMMSEGAKCSGPDSVVHAHELSRIGRIVRQALGLTVR